MRLPWSVLEIQVHPLEVDPDADPDASPGYWYQALADDLILVATTERDLFERAIERWVRSAIREQVTQLTEGGD